MTIKRYDTEEVIDSDGELLDPQGQSRGRAHIFVMVRRAVHDASTSRHPDAELPGLRQTIGTIGLHTQGSFGVPLDLIGPALTMRLDSGRELVIRITNNDGDLVVNDL